MRVPHPGRNVFDLSHERKITCDMGKLIPIMCEEVVPGDYFKVSTAMMVRLQALVAPMMHKVDVYTHFFFVPNRLVWTDWEKFITGGEDGKDATEWPHIAMPSVSTGTLLDYLGLPVGVAGPLVSALKPRAYGLIWNEWYRNQNHQAKVTVSTGNGLDTTTNLTLLSRNWEKDYFTSALPWAQRGDPVTLPLGSEAPVLGIGKKTGVFGASGFNVRESNGASRTYSHDTEIGATADTTYYVEENGTTGYPNIRADLSDATAATINQIRQAFQVQKWMERNARAGARYVESILAHFGVRSSDQRLQRPEYLGGGKSPITVSEVLQTSESNTTPLGTMGGHAFGAQSNHAFARTFEEHGFIVGIMSIMPRTAYQQGIARSWNRRTKFDYYFPEFANLGEQEILNREIYVDGTSADDQIFGYQGRYDEYRRRENSVHGLFRDTGVSGLGFWHMGRVFASRPTLTSSFITADPTQRVFAVTNVPHCLVQLYNKVDAVRPIPLVGEPGFVDH